jgi:hypothetical protein
VIILVFIRSKIDLNSDRIKKLKKTKKGRRITNFIFTDCNRERVLVNMIPL